MLILGTAAIHFALEVAGRYHYPVISLFALLAGGGAVMMTDLIFRNKVLLLSGRTSRSVDPSP